MTQDGQYAQSTLKPHAVGMIGGLILQYLLGMTANLFVTFPEGKHGGQLWLFAWRQVSIAIHIILGFLLLIGTIALLVRAIREKSTSWITVSIIALVGIIGAITGGSLFIPSQTAIYSFVMAAGFIVALLAYFWGLYTDR